MLGYYRKSLLHLAAIARTISTPFPKAQVQLLFPPSSSFSPFCTLNYNTDRDTSEKQSFTVNYLVKNCGFLPDSALRASKRVLFQTPQKPDSVIALFRSFGFSESQLHDVVRRLPRLLLSNPSKTLLPKLLFLQSKGASHSQLSNIIALNPTILQRSLRNHLIPTFDLINAYLQSEEKTVFSIRRGCQILSCHRVQRNIAFLIDAGVREISMARILRQWPWLMTYNSSELRSKVEEVVGLGISPWKANFVPAVYAKVLPKTMWDKKVKLYKKWGWTDDAICRAFVRHPFCMLTSEQKINAGMVFFVRKLGWEPLALAGYPVLLSLSLEKRVVPRASVLKVLVSKGLAKSTKIMGAYTFCEESFLRKFVLSYEDLAPQLLKLYRKKLKASGSG